MDQERLNKIEAHLKKLQEDGKLSGKAILDVIQMVDKKARKETKEKVVGLLNET
jgi:hypothetical protein